MLKETNMPDLTEILQSLADSLKMKTFLSSFALKMGSWRKLTDTAHVQLEDIMEGLTGLQDLTLSFFKCVLVTDIMLDKLLPKLVALPNLFWIRSVNVMDTKVTPKMVKKIWSDLSSKPNVKEVKVFSDSGIHEYPKK